MREEAEAAAAEVAGAGLVSAAAAERAAREEAERLARAGEDRRRREESARLAREERERRALEEAERLAREEAERLLPSAAKAEETAAGPVVTPHDETALGALVASAALHGDAAGETEPAGIAASGDDAEVADWAAFSTWRDVARPPAPRRWWSRRRRTREPDVAAEEAPFSGESVTTPNEDVGAAAAAGPQPVPAEVEPVPAEVEPVRAEAAPADPAEEPKEDGIELPPAELEPAAPAPAAVTAELDAGVAAPATAQVEDEEFATVAAEAGEAHVRRPWWKRIFSPAAAPASSPHGAGNGDRHVIDLVLEPFEEEPMLGLPVDDVVVFAMDGRPEHRGGYVDLGAAVTARGAAVGATATVVMMDGGAPAAGGGGDRDGEDARPHDGHPVASASAGRGRPRDDDDDEDRVRPLPPYADDEPVEDWETFSLGARGEDSGPPAATPGDDDFTLDDLDGISEEHYYLQAITQEHEGLAEAVASAATEEAELQALSAGMPGMDSGVVGFDDVVGTAGPDVVDEAREGDEELIALSRGSNLALRVVTGALLVGIFALAIWLGQTALVVLLLAVALVAMAEFYGALLRSGYRPLALFGFVGGAGTILAVRTWGTISIPMGVLATLVAVFLFYTAFPRRQDLLANGSVTVTVMTWVAGLGAFAVPIIEAVEFRVLVVALVGLTVIMDIGQYAAGRSWGEHKMAPALSPRKTVEGLVGGIVVTLIAGAVAGQLGLFDPLELSDGLILAAVVVVLGPLGDLSVSMVKRSLGIKDMGGILPGHGGVLDRIDGLILVMPGFWLALEWLGYLS